MLSGRRMQNFGNTQNSRGTIQYTMTSCPKTRRTADILQNSKNQKFVFKGMLLERSMQNFRKLAQLKIPKIEGNYAKKGIFLNPNTGKMSKIQESF